MLVSGSSLPSAQLLPSAGAGGAGADPGPVLEIAANIAEMSAGDFIISAPPPFRYAARLPALIIAVSTFQFATLKAMKEAESK